MGADWYSWDYDSRRDNPFGNLGQPVNRIRATQKNAAFYFQDLVELAPATRLSFGWRRERVRYDANDTLDPPRRATADSRWPRRPRRRPSTRMPGISGCAMRLTRELTGYARVGRAFRFANVDEVYDFDTFFNPQFQFLKPQHSITWESGRRVARARQFPARRRCSASTSPTRSISIRSRPGSATPTCRLRAARGSNWTAAGRLHRQLRLSAGYAYTDARFLKGVLPGGPFAIGTDIDVAGKRVPLVPKHKLNAGVDLGHRRRGAPDEAFWATSRQYMDNDEPNTLGVRIPGYRGDRPQACTDVQLGQRIGWRSTTSSTGTTTPTRCAASSSPTATRCIRCRAAPSA